jgi:hypothetical protein
VSARRSFFSTAHATEPVAGGRAEGSMNPLDLITFDATGFDVYDKQ